MDTRVHDDTYYLWVAVSTGHRLLRGSECIVLTQTICRQAFWRGFLDVFHEAQVIAGLIQPNASVEHTVLTRDFLEAVR